MRQARPTGKVCAAQAEVRPHGAKWSRGRVSHRQINPIKSGPQSIATAQGRIRGRIPMVLPLAAIGRSHLGNLGLRLLNARPKRLNSSFPKIFRHTRPIGTPNTLKGCVTQPAHDLVDSLARYVMGGPFEVPGLKVINEEFDCEYE